MRKQQLLLSVCATAAKCRLLIDIGTQNWQQLCLSCSLRYWHLWQGMPYQWHIVIQDVPTLTTAQFNYSNLTQTNLLRRKEGERKWFIYRGANWKKNEGTTLFFRNHSDTEKMEVRHFKCWKNRILYLYMCTSTIKEKQKVNKWMCPK